MARADRLFRLMQLMRGLPAPVTAERLAAESGVSQRTLYRDIDTLRAGGALIDGAPGYGYTLTEDTALPPQSFSREEIEALVLGLAEVRYMGDRALAEAAETALSKITATLPERQQRQAMHAVVKSYRFEGRPEPVIHMGALRDACWRERALELTYVDLEGRRTVRRIWPLSIVFFEKAQMCLAWCCLRQGFRRFRLDRMERLEVTGESFRPQRVPLLREFIAEIRAEANEGVRDIDRAGQGRGSRRPA